MQGKAHLAGWSSNVSICIGALLYGAIDRESLQRRLIGRLANGLDIMWKERVLA